MNRRDFLETAAGLPLVPFLSSQQTTTPIPTEVVPQWQGVAPSAVDLYFEHNGRYARYTNSTRMSAAEAQQLYSTKPTVTDAAATYTECLKWHCGDVGVFRDGLWNPQSLTLNLAGPKEKGHPPFKHSVLHSTLPVIVGLTAYDPNQPERLLWQAELILRRYNLLCYPSYDVQTYDFDVNKQV